jgi:hypothetical protein
MIEFLMEIEDDAWAGETLIYFVIEICAKIFSITY